MSGTTCTTSTILTIVAAALGGCVASGGAAGKDGWIPLDVKLPRDVFGEPQFFPRNEPNVEKPRRGRRPPLLVPPPPLMVRQSTARAPSATSHSPANSNVIKACLQPLMAPSPY